MKRVKQLANNTNKTEESERPLTSNLSLDERLKVIANLIVDRIIEDQQNGTLHFKTLNK